MPTAPKFLSPTRDSCISCLLNMLNRCLTPTKSEAGSLIPVHPSSSSPPPFFVSPFLPVTGARNRGAILDASFSHPHFPSVRPSPGSAFGIHPEPIVSLPDLYAASWWALYLHPCPPQSLLSIAATENGGLLCSGCPRRSPSHSEGKPKTLPRPRGPACPAPLCLPC